MNKIEKIKNFQNIMTIIKHKEIIDYLENGEKIEIATSRLSVDDWQEFKRKFVLEYGGEPVQPSGMTHSEFLNYIKTSGLRENDEFDSWIPDEN